MAISPKNLSDNGGSAKTILKAFQIIEGIIQYPKTTPTILPETLANKA